ncbi:type II toxin -antitoxin system TacA 1-like antitoxin [Actinomadura hibisca]|uniref:type II toxin -antitoxin system TacA 1-like antitoxin n=1 Tax=Actinomadura hibisca TaxID=68565 RepID=UPI00082ACBE2|nr:DUF1778 domain-containing protein [Actinomadura hibisca]
MSESVRQDLPATRQIELPVTEEQHLVIRKAADLLGWTVNQYVLCAVLDRAERELYEHAAVDERADGDRLHFEETAAPFVALIAAL